MDWSWSWLFNWEADNLWLWLDRAWLLNNYWLWGWENLWLNGEWLDENWSLGWFNEDWLHGLWWGNWLNRFGWEDGELFRAWLVLLGLLSLVWLLWCWADFHGAGLLNHLGLFNNLDLGLLLWEWLRLLESTVSGLAFWALGFWGGGEESGGLESWESGGGQQISLTTFAEWLFWLWGGFQEFRGGLESDWLSGGGGSLTFLTSIKWFLGWGQSCAGGSGESGGQFSLTFAAFLGDFQSLLGGASNWSGGGGNGLTFSTLLGDIRSTWCGTGSWGGGSLEGLSFSADFRGLGSGSARWGKGGSSNWGLSLSFTFEETFYTLDRLTNDALWGGGPRRSDRRLGGLA